jgi:intracellular septation protein A
MKNLLHAGKYLAQDMASTIVFLIMLGVFKSVPLAVGTGVAMGLGQLALQLVQRRKIDGMQWLSLFLVLASGAATFITHDARFVMIKPSVIYVVVGVYMLRRGWMNRYLPPVALQWAGDVAVAFGYVWAGLMFVSAGLNIAVALRVDPLTWAAWMSAYALATKLALFFIQFAAMRLIGGRRHRLADSAAIAVPA